MTFERKKRCPSLAPPLGATSKGLNNLIDNNFHLKTIWKSAKKNLIQK